MVRWLIRRRADEPKDFTPELITRFEQKSDHLTHREAEYLLSHVTQGLQEPRSMLQWHRAWRQWHRAWRHGSQPLLLCQVSSVGVLHFTRSCCTSSDMAAVSITAFLMYTLERGHHEQGLGLADCYPLLGEGLALLGLPRSQGPNRSQGAAKGLLLFFF